MKHELRLEKLAKSVKAFGLPALFGYLQWSCETCKYRIGVNYENGNETTTEEVCP